MKNIPQTQSPTTHGARLAGAMVTALLVAMAPAGFAASIKGAVINTSGDPLAKVTVCLKASSSDRDCVKLRRSDQRGNYQFKGLKAGQSYSVEVFQDSSASGRKFEQYKTYVWEPQVQHAAVTTKNETIRLVTFAGKFNFSNFQRALTLTSVDFPELSSIDLQSDYVALKVFLPSPDQEQPPETIFLGQVTGLEQLLIEASVPLAVTEIGYEIFSASLSISGSIMLANN